MKVVIIGGGRTSAQLAKLLHEENHEIRLIEFRKDILVSLHKELPTELIVEGDPVETVVLEEAGIAQADVLAATSTLDQVNLVLCYIARERYKVPRTIARVNNPSNAWLFNENFHVDVAVNQAEITAALIGEEMSLGSQSLFPCSNRRSFPCRWPFWPAGPRRARWRKSLRPGCASPLPPAPRERLC